MSGDQFHDTWLADTTRIRGQADALLRDATDEQLRRPQTVGDWSCADVLAHLAGYTRGVADLLRGARGAKPMSPPYGAPPGLSDDDFNAVVVAYWRRRALVELLDEERTAYQSLVDEVSILPIEAITTPAWFGFTGGRSLEAILPAQCVRHYGDHLPALEDHLKPWPR